MKKTTLNIYLALSLLTLPGLASATTEAKVDTKPKSVVVKNVKYEDAFNRALAAYLQNDYEKTIQEGLDVLQYDPNGDLHAMLGDSFFKLNRGGKTEKHQRGILTARALMEKVVKINPNNKAANNTLGNIYSNGLGVPVDNDKAFKYFKVNADQGSLVDAFNAAQVAQTQGKLDVALDLYEKTLDGAFKEGVSSGDQLVEAIYRNMAFIFYDDSKKFHDRRIKYLPAYAENPYRTGRFLLEVALDYKNGNGVPKSKEKFFQILKHVADADATVKTDFFYRLAARDALTRAYLSKEFFNEMEAFNYAFSTSSTETIALVSKTPTFQKFSKTSNYVVENNLPKAIPALKEEIKKGNRMAEPLLALFELSGYGDAPVEQKQKAAKILEKAVYQGNYVGFDTLVMANLIDDVLKPNVNLAKTLVEIRKSDKTEKMSEKEQENLYLLEGLIDYKSGNKARGLDKIKKIAEKGNVKAMMNIYMLYMEEGKLEEAEKYLNLIQKSETHKKSK